MLLVLATKQWTYQYYNMDSNGIFYLKFPIAFIKFKNATSAIHSGSGEVMFGVVNDYTLEKNMGLTIRNINDLNGSYIFALNQDKQKGRNWPFYTFTPGC